MGPTLYILYTNDMRKKKINEGKLLKYADDTAIPEKGKELKEVIKNLQSEVKEVEKWFDNNGIEINGKKSVLIITTSKKRNIRGMIENCEIEVGGNKIKPSKNVKYLGLIIDDELNWKAQIKEVIDKLNLKIMLMYKIKNKVNEKNKKQIYHGLIESIIIHSIGIWGSINITYMKIIQRKLNVIIRILYNIRRKKNIEDFMRQKMILSSYALYNKMLTKKAWNSIHNKEKGQMKLSIEDPKIEGRTTRSEGRFRIKIGKWRTKKGKRSNLTRMKEIANEMEKEMKMIQRARTERYPKKEITNFWNRKNQEELKANWR